VQAAVEDAVAAAFGETVVAHAAGRTDAGVHALAMPAHLDIARSTTPFRVMEALNHHLRAAGHAVAAVAAEAAPEDWHARFSCTGRAYEYRIANRRAPLTWEAGLALREPRPLDDHAMAAGAALLLGQHDFTTFRSAACQSASPVKTLDRLDVMRDGDRITVHAAARSFLHHQVRSMVGCLMLVGRGEWPPERIEKALAARNRGALGLNAAPDGLWFVGARY
jgi:tRNA pseudouridine38-40 synthase